MGMERKSLWTTALDIALDARLFSKADTPLTCTDASFDRP